MKKRWLLVATEARPLVARMTRMTRRESFGNAPAARSQPRRRAAERAAHTGDGRDRPRARAMHSELDARYRTSSRHAPAAVSGALRPAGYPCIISHGAPASAMHAWSPREPERRFDRGSARELRRAHLRAPARETRATTVGVRRAEDERLEPAYPRTPPWVSGRDSGGIATPFGRELVAHAFRGRGLGPIVGTRTWGGC